MSEPQQAKLPYPIFQEQTMQKRAIRPTTILALSLSGYGYNTSQTNDEQIKASWAEVLNQYSAK